MHINICQLEGLHPKSTTAATAELKHSDIRRVGIYWQDVCHLGGHWYCHIFVSKHFHQKMKTKERLFNFQSSPTAVPPPNFGIVSCYRRTCSAEIPGIRYAVDEAEAERCPQEESLKVVLRNLGIPEAKLQGSLRKFPGVRWSLWQCNKNQPKKMVQDFLGQKSLLWKVVKFPGRPRLLKKTVVGMKTCSKSRQICEKMVKDFWGQKNVRKWGSLYAKIYSQWKKLWCLGSDRPANAEASRRPQLRRQVDPIPWPRPRWLVASRHRQADEVAGPRPERHKRLGFVGRLGEPHGVARAQPAPHPRHGPVGRLAQGQRSVDSRSDRYRSHRWRDSFGQRHRAKPPPFVKHGRVWWAEILGKTAEVGGAGVVKHGRVWWAETLGKSEQVGGAGSVKHGRVWWVEILGEDDGVEAAGSGQPESRRWRSSDGRMVKDRTRGPLRHRGGVCQVRLSPAVPATQGNVLDGATGAVVPVEMPFAAGTALSWRLQDSTVGTRPSEALRGVQRAGHAQGCRVRPHRASLAGDPWQWSGYFHWPVAFEPSAKCSGPWQQQRHGCGKTPWQLQDFGLDWKSRRQLRRWCCGEGHQGDGLHRSAQRHVRQSEWRFAEDWATRCCHTMCSVVL